MCETRVDARAGTHDAALRSSARFAAVGVGDSDRRP
jgi:hypothetical protein